jgi:hypothetical protein
MPEKKAILFNYQPGSQSGLASGEKDMRTSQQYSSGLASYYNHIKTHCLENPQSHPTYLLLTGVLHLLPDAPPEIW